MNKVKKLIEWIKKAYYSPGNIPRMIYQAFFCETKSGECKKTFSSKKNWAFLFSFLAGYSKISLMFWPKHHWSVVLTKEGVDAIVITTIMISMDALAMGALSIYGWCKIKKAA